jgi:hypothetical protein
MWVTSLRGKIKQKKTLILNKITKIQSPRRTSDLYVSVPVLLRSVMYKENENPKSSTAKILGNMNPKNVICK